jgi:hypothetical protein
VESEQEEEEKEEEKEEEEKEEEEKEKRRLPQRRFPPISRFRRRRILMKAGIILRTGSLSICMGGLGETRRVALGEG